MLRKKHGSEFNELKGGHKMALSSFNKSDHHVRNTVANLMSSRADTKWRLALLTNLSITVTEMDFLMGADTLPGYISSPTRVTPRPPYT
jgi:hypothetical protein